jgi:type IV fimbrial biogenesis protein FimT
LEALMRCRSRGFTLIEMLVTVAIIVILLTVVAPSFTGYLATKRVDGLMTEFGTDLQYARSEAVARNAPVRITFGTRCYVLTEQPTDGTAPTSSCTQTANPVLGTGVSLVKPVQITGASTDFTPLASLAWIEFDPVRGIATFSTGAASGEVMVTASGGTPQLRAVVQTVGRFCIDSPDSSIRGYSACS